jgi:hypothetical protein
LRNFSTSNSATTVISAEQQEQIGQFLKDLSACRVLFRMFVERDNGWPASHDDETFG